MNIKKSILFGALALSTMSAGGVVLEDFESYKVGDKVTLYNYWGNTPAGTGVIVVDPANASNKVLHVTISGWGNFAKLTLPEELQGRNLCDTKSQVLFRIYRTSSDQNEWKKVQVYQDNALLYEDDGYPSQGAVGQWQQRAYNLPQDGTGLTFNNGGKVLALGFNSEASDYYIDDIAVKGPWDDYVTVEGKMTKDVSKQNTSSTYENIATNFRMMPGSELTLNTARYTYITGKVVGEGTVNIYSGGERTYIGGSNKYTPDWSGFKGNVHIYPYKNLSSSNGFYGLIWMYNGKTFSTSTALVDMAETNPVSDFLKSKVTLHDGAVLVAESGNRGIRIGHLDTEKGSFIHGYYKSATANSYYVVGNDGTDATLAGTIAPYNNLTTCKVGLYKEGLGTYRITGNNNNIGAGVAVLRGRVLVNNDVAEAKEKKLLGGVGNVGGVTIYKDGIAGGTGNIAGTSNVYGILQPGDDGIGTITFANYASTAKPTLIMRPTGRIDCEIGSMENYDKVVVDGPVTYYNTDQEFSESQDMPRLRIRLTPDADLHEGDSFVLFKANSKTLYNNVSWNFNIIYPKAYTWSVTEEQGADGYQVVARVTSVIYTGQGDVEDKDDKPGSSTDDGTFDVIDEQKNTSPLRHFVDDKGAYVGTCVPTWSINVDNDKDSRTSVIVKEFNMVVAENEMKFDATEPSRNTFSLTEGNRLINMAQRNNMRVRGHALVWYSQVPAWVSSDGYKNNNNFTRKELLDVLHNHIKKLVTTWKGKVHEWDVANEVLDDNQSTINTNPKGYDLRRSVWATVIGEDYLDSAFVWAHKYDPDAVLILNDYGVEGKGWGKSQALYNLAMRLKNSGIPIHGVGSQAHMDAGLGYTASIEENIKYFKDAGFECHITELDLGIDGSSDENLAKQAESYYRMARIAMRNSNCKSLMIWGLKDDMSWRQGKNPLLFNSSLQKKPAYWAVHAALRQFAGEEIETGVIDMHEDAAMPIGNGAVYNLQGQKVNVMQRGKIYILNGIKVMY